LTADLVGFFATPFAAFFEPPFAAPFAATFAASLGESFRVKTETAEAAEAFSFLAASFSCLCLSGLSDCLPLTILIQ
jgi:hypothetical protein